MSAPTEHFFNSAIGRDIELAQHHKDKLTASELVQLARVGCIILSHRDRKRLSDNDLVQLARVGCIQLTQDDKERLDKSDLQLLS